MAIYNQVLDGAKRFMTSWRGIRMKKACLRQPNECTMQVAEKAQESFGSTQSLWSEQC